MAIPLRKDVQINPGVLPAGGSALDLNGLILTDSAYAPVGSVITFTNKEDVAAYFGSASAEFSMAEVYFQGYDNSTKTRAHCCLHGLIRQMQRRGCAQAQWRP